MHADGYAGFEELYRGGDIREVACLAHVRRKWECQEFCVSGVRPGYVMAAFIP
jgi:hypothetical protein